MGLRNMGIPLRLGELSVPQTLSPDYFLRCQQVPGAGLHSRRTCMAPSPHPPLALLSSDPSDILQFSPHHH